VVESSSHIQAQDRVVGGLKNYFDGRHAFEERKSN